MTDPLVPSLLSLRFVLGEIQCLAAQVFQAIVYACLYITLWAAQLRLSCCVLALMLWMYYSKLP